MEAKYLPEPQRESFDIISTLPQAIIETILCRLPIQGAARTSILSRDWRYKWTTTPKLAFNMYTVSTSKETQTSELASATENMDERCKLFYAIHQVLLLHQGPIHEFTLNMEVDHHYFEIDQIILHLSRNHALKKLTLMFDRRRFYKLPICAYSLHQLTDLDLSYINLDHQPIFNGYRNLKSLCLFDVRISTKALVHLLSNCPSLANFTLCICDLTGDKDCRIIELFESLPLIEHLDVYPGNLLEMFVTGLVPKELPTSLIHLKYVCLQEMWLLGDELCFLLLLIKCSSNLEKIRLFEQLDFDPSDDFETCPITYAYERYSDVWAEHLNKLELELENNFKHQIEFVKFIMARSPNLKKVQVSFTSETVQQKSDFLKALLQIPRVSPVEIVVV